MVTKAGGTYMACDTDSIMVVASPKGGMVPGARRPLIEVEGNMNMEAIKPIPSLSHDTVKKITSRFRALNPYRFGGELLKIEEVNYAPDKKGRPSSVLRTIHGFAISAKRYCLQEGDKIVEVKGHGLGYLMSPAPKDDQDWMVGAWQYVLQVDAGFVDSEPDWLDYPAMMKIPVSSPAVLGRLKGFCKPYDFVLAPIIRNSDLAPESQAEKPILITRFTKYSEEWLNADLIIAVRKGHANGPTVRNAPADTIIFPPTHRQPPLTNQPPDGSTSRGPHISNEAGPSEDMLEVYMGKVQNPLDAAPLWRYMAKDALNGPQVKAVEQFQNAVDESEKQYQRKP